MVPPPFATLLGDRSDQRLKVFVAQEVEIE
jgi:hypothetical protein